MITAISQLQHAAIYDARVYFTIFGAGMIASLILATMAMDVIIEARHGK